MTQQQATLFFSRDPGAADVLVAFYDCLRGKARMPRALTRLAQESGAVDSVIYAKDAAARVWREAGIEPLDWKAVVPDDASIEQRNLAVHTILSRYGIKRVITGTSDIDEDTDRALWRAAYDRSIPSHVFIDHSDNLPARFRERDGTLVLPDYVYVLENAMKQAMHKIGMPKPRIGVCGHMHLERMQRIERPSDTAIARLRGLWGAEESDLVILFPSGCGREMAALGRPNDHDELLVLNNLIEDVSAGRPVGDRTFASEDTVLVIRPHPRDTAAKYDSYRRERGPRVVVSAEGSPPAAVLAADVVAGIDSLLRLAETLGRPAVWLVGAGATARPRT